MKFVTAFCGLLAVVAIAVAGAPLSHAQSAGWTTLFDGKNFDNWTKLGPGDIQLIDGAAQATTVKGTSHLVSKEKYGDFELRAEVWIDPTSNSGIFIRGQDAAKVGNATAYEVNVFDARPDPKYATASLVDVAPASTVVKGGGKWNVLEITAKGPLFSVTFNGVKTVDNTRSDKFGPGIISLQFGEGVVKFRKVEIRRL